MCVCRGGTQAGERAHIPSDLEVGAGVHGSSAQTRGAGVADAGAPASAAGVGTGAGTPAGLGAAAERVSGWPAFGGCFKLHKGNS